MKQHINQSSLLSHCFKRNVATFLQKIHPHIVNGLNKGAGVCASTSHSGRRTRLTNLADRGVAVKTLMALTAHSHIATTQRYIDLHPTMLKAAVGLV
jgi:integrase/recombinase XerD